MIRYYTYYSCGGYKDMYIGSDQDSADASYFIPLLNVWRKSNKTENVEKITKAESVQQVELITKNNPAGFPTECNMMFSHGGYNAIYRTLKDGRVCLCIRDIPNVSKDEEGRDIPFNFMFVANGQESIEKLDGLALEYLSKGKEINDLIAESISYDYVMNGVRFDLSKLNQIFSLIQNQSNLIQHKAGIIDYIKISSRKQYKLALSEQAIDANNVNSFWDDSGLFYGNLIYSLQPSTKINNQDIVERQSDKESINHKETEALNDKVITEYPDKSDENSNIEEHELEIHEAKPLDAVDNLTDNSKSNDNASELSIQQVEHKLSLLATRCEIKDAQAVIKNSFDEVSYTLDRIMQKLNDIKESSISMPSAVSNQTDTNFVLNNKYIILAIGCLIAGTILGALIF